MYGMSIPSRTSLWLGIIIYVVGYYIQATPVMVIGGCFIGVGMLLWFVWGDKTKKKRKKTRNLNIKNIFNIDFIKEKLKIKKH